MNTYILYHGNCPDGFGAAWAAWKKLGDAATYLPVQHDLPMPELEAGAQVYIVDFSYPADVLQPLSELMHSIIVLDHHKTAQEGLAGLPHLDELEAGQGNIGVLFDMEKSGAMLAWEYFHPNEPVPELIRYVQDKDLWQFKLPDSKAFSAGLSSYPFDFEFWDTLDIKQLKQEGHIILRMSNNLVERLMDRVYWRDLGGYHIPVVNSPFFGSDLGHTLCQRFPEAPFAASYSDKDANKRIWELRSEGDFDVSAVAKQLGGGGHRNAAGFTEFLSSGTHTQD